MRLARFDAGRGPELGLLQDGNVSPLGYATLGELLADPDPAATITAAAARGRTEPLDGARVLAPQASPTKMLFCGINYRSHLDENPGATLPREPFFFAKLTSAIVGPGDAIVMPAPDTLVDYEVELAAVIGRRARRVAPDVALDHVFGYTLVNDVSARDIQFRDNQVTLGKNPDTFCPMGPAIVLRDELPSLDGVRIATTVNGELRQEADAGEMLFGVAELIARASALMTLEPGDLVTTGTPAGVACFRNPPAYLHPGDEVTVSADRIGELTNRVEQGW